MNKYINKYIGKTSFVKKQVVVVPVTIMKEVMG